MKKLSKDEMKKIMGGSGQGPGGCGELLSFCGSIYDPPCCSGYSCVTQILGDPNHDPYVYQSCQISQPGGV